MPKINFYRVLDAWPWVNSNPAFHVSSKLGKSAASFWSSRLGWAVFDPVSTTGSFSPRAKPFQNQLKSMSKAGKRIALQTDRVNLLRAEEEPDLVRQILSYFVRNPNAADTLEGITRWRLLEEQLHRSLQETERALAWLVAQGFLDEVKTPGAPPLFRLRLERRADVVAFVERKSRDHLD